MKNDRIMIVPDIVKAGISLACCLFLSAFGNVALAQDRIGGQAQGQGASGNGKEAETTKQQAALPVITLSPDKVQLIGVRTAVAEYRPLGKEIRTVGKVVPDETRLAYVNTKVSGWVKKLYVDYTGKEVVKGQPLLSLYSPDLVTAQEEYLIAIQAAKSGSGGSGELESSQQELIESAKRRLQLWDITDQQIAELEKNGKPQTDMIIEAPLSGIVLEKMVLEGAYISPGMNLYRIADLSTIWILADIYEYEVPLVRIGQSARVTLPYQSGEAYRAEVNYVYPTLDPVTRTVKVRLVMKNPRLLLKPEMFANVEINVFSGSRLVIPRSAVIDSGMRQIVYVEKKPGVYEQRQVTLGLRGEDSVEIVKGIVKGDRVVTSGNFLIDSESQLRTSN
ncbi:MAG TPA: efflux RND transporter periplasmic adaptor subunit [Nitrospirota bacterium]|nr:efflux RND transporter periplasmic adaptor subunit [Nitrospirota bacterium]